MADQKAKLTLEERMQARLERVMAKKNQGGMLSSQKTMISVVLLLAYFTYIPSLYV